MASKSKYWVGVLYPENMIDTWQDDIGELLQLPYSYCIHDKDTTSKSKEDRKVHVHIVVAFPNTTTYNHALSVFKRLGEKSINTCESVINMGYMYDYLIHDTDDSRKKGKYQYDASERICGNNFDIGCFEQLSTKEKEDIAKELCDLIIAQSYTNFVDFYMDAITNVPNSFEIIKTHSGLFERMCKGNFLKGCGAS